MFFQLRVRPTCSASVHGETAYISQSAISFITSILPTLAWKNEYEGQEKLLGVSLEMIFLRHRFKGKALTHFSENLTKHAKDWDILIFGSNFLTFQNNFIHSALKLKSLFADISHWRPIVT